MILFSNLRSPWLGIRNADIAFSRKQTVAVHKRGKYPRNASLGTLWCRRLFTVSLFLHPAVATGVLTSFRNTELPKYAVPCRRCLSEDVDTKTKKLASFTSKSIKPHLSLILLKHAKELGKVKFPS